MQKLAEILDAERNRLFIGRKSELDLVQDWLKRVQAPTEVLFLSGIGGVGKSALMLQFISLAHQEAVHTIWLDGRTCTDSPAGFIQALYHSYLSHPQDNHTFNSFKELVTAIAARKTVLCIDNYEAIQRIDGWLREVFLSSFPAANLLVVVAGRQDLSVGWINDLAWSSRCRSVRLEPFSHIEALQYLRQRGWNNTNEMNQLVSQSRGLPLAMVLFAERLWSQERQTGSSAWPVPMQISAGMLRESASDEFKDLIDILCIVPHATPEWLGRFLGAPLTSAGLQRICQLSFIRPAAAGGIALHDVARTFLVQDFRLREPDRYKALWHRIIKKLAIELKQATNHEQRRIASVMLSTCQDMYHIHSISVLMSHNQNSMYMESFQPFDLPHLHQMMKEESQYSFSVEIDHAIMDLLFAHFPNGIRVYRNSEGKPLAFTAGLLLYKQTVALLERLFPGLLDTIFPKEIKRLRQMSIEEADTYYHLRASASPSDPIHTYHELVGIVTKELIFHKSIGMRYIIVTAYEETNESLQNAGFRTRALQDQIRNNLFQGAKVAIHEQDWRGTSFVDQILDLIHFAPDYESKIENFELTEKEVKAAISLINDPESLSQTELAGKLSCTGLKLQQKLQRIFLHPLPFPLNENNLALLKQYAEAPQLTVDAAAAQLHMSRATYYRIRKETLLNLRDVLTRNAN